MSMKSKSSFVQVVKKQFIPKRVLL